MTREEKQIRSLMIGLIIITAVLTLGLSNLYTIVSENEAQNLYFRTMLDELESRE